MFLIVELYSGALFVRSSCQLDATRPRANARVVPIKSKQKPLDGPKQPEPAPEETGAYWTTLRHICEVFI